MKAPVTGIKTVFIGLFLIAMSVPAFAQSSDVEQKIKDLSKQKWEWMADKNVDKLASLFHEQSKFVHMSGTWSKDRELEIIESGSIWYKDADVHEVAVEIVGNTAILWNRITLLAVVGGNEVSNEFTVTEVYQQQEDGWKLLDLTFSSVRDTHSIE
ncbi:MAG: nuclear transport factor 2 family protein [Candidatus Halalkalibacterium sp. M3_1C_030]